VKLFRNKKNGNPHLDTLLGSYRQEVD